MSGAWILSTTSSTRLPAPFAAVPSLPTGRISSRRACSPRYEALLIPDSAIGSEQARKFVYVVRPDNSVAQKYVVLGPLSEGDRVIRSGLEADDRVIVSGLMRVRPGVKVTPQTGAASAPGAAANAAKK
jgi:hypothetical protein